MSKEHEVTRVASDSLGCKLNRAESELSGSRKREKAARREAEKPAVFKNLIPKKGLDK